MKHNVVIGELKDRTKVMISDISPNQHMALFGISGSGKSVRIEEIAEGIVSNGDTVIALDIDGRGYKNVNANRISAIKDGLNLRFLDFEMVDNYGAEYINFVSYVLEMLSASVYLGSKQEGALRLAIEYALEHKTQYKTEMEAISYGLKEQESSTAESVYNRLWNVLNGDIFRESTAYIKKGHINVISLQGLNPRTQKQVSEIVLASIWRQLRREKINTIDSLYIIIDEFQNLSLKKNSVLLEMLREARKYHANLILATQSLAGISSEIQAAIHQTAVQLYFRPNQSELRKVAEMIDPQNQDRYLLLLKRLKVGESVVTGNATIRGKEIHRPVIIKSAYQFNEKHKAYKSKVPNMITEKRW